MRVEYHAQTVSDLNNAVAFYDNLQPGVGSKLRNEVYQAIDRICLTPGRFPFVERDVRRCWIQKFPYTVLFRKLTDDAVRVLAIRHHRQRANYGLQRR